MIQWTTKEERERRQLICDSCDKKKGVRCGVCGCFLIAMRKLGTCPLGKF